MWVNVVYIVLLFIYVVVFAYAVWMEYYKDGFLYLMLSLVFVGFADIYYEVGRRLTGAYMLVVAVLLALGVVV
jgi:Gpi18-like mannosyltransferase